MVSYVQLNNPLETPLPPREFILEELARINRIRPLKGGSPPDRPSKSLYSIAATGYTLRKRVQEADALIERRGLERRS